MTITGEARELSDDADQRNRADVAARTNAIKAEALREAAEDFRRAAASGVVPVLNLTASQQLLERARRVELGERGYSIISSITRETPVTKQTESKREG